ncbi:MAG: PIN domain-containing protein [Armatimonadaceae bacterium]
MILTDTGPLIALLAEGDPYQEISRRSLLKVTLPLLVPLPCWVEAMYLLGNADGYKGQNTLWGWYLSGAVRIFIPSDAQIERACILMEEYKDTPCDFADAVLVASAEVLGLKRIFTLDNDFYIYRLKDNTFLEPFPGAQNRSNLS